MKNANTMSGGYFLELLPSDVQSKIVENLVHAGELDVASEILRIRDEEFINIADMLASAFDWDTSIEGRKYWENVINSKYDNKNLSDAVNEIFESRIDKVSDVISSKLNDMLSDLFGSKVVQYVQMQDEILDNPGSFKTGEYYIKYLSEDERKRFEDNLFKINTHPDNYFSQRYYSFDDFIGGAFPFIGTNEGIEFWRNIRNRDIPADLDSVLDELNISKQE